jgi:hypothetical protein
MGSIIQDMSWLKKKPIRINCMYLMQQNFVKVFVGNKLMNNAKKKKRCIEDYCCGGLTNITATNTNYY